MSIKSRLEKVTSLYFDIGSGPPSHLLRPAFSKVDSCTYQQKTILELFPFSWYWRGIDTMIKGSVESCWQRSNLPGSKGFTNLINIADGDWGEVDLGQRCSCVLDRGHRLLLGVVLSRKLSRQIILSTLTQKLNSALGKYQWPLFLALKIRLFSAKSDIFIPQCTERGGGSTGLENILKKKQFF